MMTILLAASPIVDQTRLELAKSTSELRSQGLIPRMEVILVGKNPASVLYTSKKKKFCESVGAECEIICLDANTDEKTFLSILKNSTQNSLVHGCFVQLPLPKQLQHLDIARLIPAHKDVDGFHPENIYQVVLSGAGELSPCTPKGVMALLAHYRVPLLGAEVVVIGRSMIVGKPMALMLMQENATVTLCHSKTKDLKAHTQRADIIISAVGKAKFLDATYLNKNKKQWLIDVGINQDDQGKLCGDIDAEAVEGIAHALSPVPGGVGPMTILTLVQNLLQAAKKNL
jgi:methylenetetrahydrofolate dehydrogenase (NADP+)/methenyltetrahydrofolate cyclohydrolase